jgi:hypothetical protein
VRRLHHASALAVGVALLAAAVTSTAGAKPSGKGPTEAQIRAAVRRAEHSKDLWATINVCRRKGREDIIGIRGQMPSLGFTSDLSLVVQPQYWAYDQAKFKPVPGDARRVSLGAATHAVLQGGASFRFKHPAGLLRGTITFEWRLKTRLLASTVRKTTHGHRHVDFADPPGFSAGVCSFR